MIADEMTKYKTALPSFPKRPLTLGGFKPLQQQLLGVLVHADQFNDDYCGGFMGYLCDQSILQGTNFVVECIHRTLLKLSDPERKLRKTWPSNLYVQLDNTSAENKNRGTFGYFASLVGAGTFKKVTLSFLPVGHTHEDIDAIFGMIMRHLYRYDRLAHMEEMMDAIWDSFFAKHAKRTRNSWMPSAELEHIKGTHDWNKWLKKACKESGFSEPPVREFSNFALCVGEKACTDSLRPHRFEFTLAGERGQEHVVMTYFRWCHQKEAWCDVPIIVFNYVPKLQHLEPAKLRPDFMQSLSECQRTTVAGKDNKCPSSKNCPRCSLFAAFDCQGLFSEEDAVRWEQRFSAFSQAAANENLPRNLVLPTPNPPQSAAFTIPEICQIPQTSQLPPPVEHSHYVMESSGKLSVAGLTRCLQELRRARKNGMVIDVGPTEATPEQSSSKYKVHLAVG